MTQPNLGHPFGQLRQRTDQLIVFCDVARFDRLSHQQPDELLGDRRAVHHGLIVDGLAGELPAAPNTVVFSDVTPTATPSARTAPNLSASTTSIRSALT